MAFFVYKEKPVELETMVFSHEPCPLDLIPDGEDCFIQEAGQLYCNTTWDTYTCWPTTLAGQLAVLPCPTEVGGMRIKESGNVTRQCSVNGTWEERSNYDNCEVIPIYNNKSEEILHNYITRQIYYGGFSVSTVALSIALFIFLYYRNLRCLRNTIHCHLMVTFILRNCMWLIMDNSLIKLSSIEWACKLLVALFNYVTVTTFFWMFVEGLYLHTMIIWAFSVERIKFWIYALIGWFTPAIVITAWIIVRVTMEKDGDFPCWLPNEESGTILYDFVYITPVLIVLLINLVFMGTIVWILITKLRASNTLQARQYRKAIRATLILFPLLGVTYVLLIAPPTGDVASRRIFTYFNSVLQSTQGLAVAIFYCFLNGEVRSTLRTRLARWQDGRSVATRSTRASIATTPEQMSLYRGSINLTSIPVTSMNGGKDILGRNNNENGHKLTETLLTNR